MTTASDDELIRSTLAGERGAFAALVRRHERRIESTIRGVMGNIGREDLADIAQDILLLAFRALPSFRGEALFSTWLTRIALRHCYRESKRRRRRATMFFGFGETRRDDEAPVEGRIAAPGSTDRDIIADERRGEVTRALYALPEEFRTVLVLRVVEEMSVEEVAAALEISTGTVKSRLHRAKDKMRELLAGLELEFELEPGD